MDLRAQHTFLLNARPHRTLMDEGEEDDFANRMNLVYPPIIFQDVADDDEHLLQPLFMVMHILGMELQDPLANGSRMRFEPIIFDREHKEYTLVGEVDQDVTFPARVLNVIWSTNPARIRSMRLEPYQEAPGQPWVLRLIVKILSTSSPLMTCTLPLFLRADKTLLRPGFENHAVTVDLAAGLAQETEIIARIKRICRDLVVNKSVVRHVPALPQYNIDEHVYTQRNTNGSASVSWHLPPGGGLDVTTTSILWAEIGPAVDDVAYRMIVAKDGQSAFLCVTMFLFSPASTTLMLRQTHTYSVTSDPNPDHGDPWKVEVTGPAQYERSKRRASMRRPLPAAAAAAHTVLKSVKQSRPSNKRLRPAETLSEEDDEDTPSFDAPTPSSPPPPAKRARQDPDNNELSLWQVLGNSLSFLNFMAPQEAEDMSSHDDA